MINNDGKAFEFDKSLTHLDRYINYPVEITCDLKKDSMTIEEAKFVQGAKWMFRKIYPLEQHDIDDIYTRAELESFIHNRHANIWRKHVSDATKNI